MHSTTLASFLLLGALSGASFQSLPAQNPLTRPARAEHPFAGSFTGKDIGLELAVDGTTHEYKGWLTFQNQRYAATGDVKGGQLQGNFTVDGQSFLFTADLDGDKLSLNSDGTGYELKRQDPNPLRRGGTPPVQNPPTPQPNPTPNPIPDPTPAPQTPPAANIGGVGIGFAMNGDDELVVQAIMPGGPASKTGLKPGGILVAVDGKEVEGMSGEQVRALLQGPIGSLVKLTIDTPDELLDVVIQRGALPANAPPPPAARDPRVLQPRPDGQGQQPPEGQFPGQTFPGAQQPTGTVPGVDMQRHDATTAALPSWLRDGVRITFWSGSASLPGVRSHLVLDDTGNWVDPTSGRKFCDQKTAGSGGMGYQQFTVVHAGADGVAVDSRSYLVPDQQTGAAMLTLSTGYVGTVDGLGDYWINPARLAAMQDGTQGGVRITHMQYPLDGRQYRAVAIRSDSASGFRQCTYDLDTGLCLALSTSSTGDAVMTPNPNGTTSPGAGSTTITHTHLMSVRQLALPWAGDGLPQGLQAGQSLSYRGTYSTEIPGCPVLPWQFGSEVQFDKLGNGFAVGKLKTHLDSGMGMPQDNEQDRVFGACMIGGMFMAPQTLQQLRSQQVIDEDPITRVRTVVEGAQNGVLTITEQSQGEVSRYGYDLNSGLLRTLEQRMQNGVATTVLKVQLQSQR